MRKLLLSCTVLCFFASAVFSQTPFKVEKWGKIPEEDLKMTHCPFDSTASAMVLQEVGNSEVTFDKDGIVVLFNYWTRLKIFDEAALEEGNLLIPYYSDRDLEQFRDLDVQLILPNGERQKVKSDNIFTAKLSKSVWAKKVFVPNLQKGCIIEYRYEIKSFNWVRMYGTWYFQKEMPVRWSQLKITIPQYFYYVYLLQSPRQFDLKETKQESTLPLEGKGYMASITTYGLGNLPAVKEEPFITTLDDYRAHIGFQLSEVIIPGNYSEKFLTTWAEVAEKMTKNQDFGEQYLKSNRFDKLWAAFRKEVPETTPKTELPEKVLRFVSTNIKWNGENRRFSENGIDAAFDKKAGSSSDLNLAVVALLRKLDFDAVPMLISTRDHGAMYSIYPFSEQFNTVVAFLYEGQGGVLIDATSPFRPLGQMRESCYNNDGWLVDEKRPNWVQIAPPEYAETWLGNLKVNEEGEMDGHFTLSLEGAAAFKWRSDLEGEKEPEFLKAHFATEYPERVFDSVVISNREVLDKPLKLDFNCRIPNAATAINEFLYVKPILDFSMRSNPLRNPKRSFPVNFVYPSKAQYILNLEIPKGFVVEELPAPARIVLPDNSGKIQFSCGKISDTQLQVVLKMNIAQLDFEPEQYDALRQFFELLADKVQFQLALKKG